MKTKRIFFLIMLFFAIVPHIVVAIPGLIVRTDPESMTISNGGATVEYNVIIENQDDGRINPDTEIEAPKVDKTITAIRMNIRQPGPDWDYSFYPDPVGQVLSDGTGQSRNITLQIKTKSGAIGIFEDQVAADAKYDFCFELDNPDSCITDLEENGYATFWTEITGSSNPAPIPEFPNVALPIISVLGLMFLMHRRK